MNKQYGGKKDEEKKNVFYKQFWQQIKIMKMEGMSWMGSSSWINIKLINKMKPSIPSDFTVLLQIK